MSIELQNMKKTSNASFFAKNAQSWVKYGERDIVYFVQIGSWFADKIKKISIQPIPNDYDPVGNAPGANLTSLKAILR